MVIALLMTGCGPVIAHRGPVGGPKVLKASVDPYYLQAQHESQLLLGRVRIPPGATERSGPPPAALAGPTMGLPASSHLIDHWRLWSVPMPMGRTLAWIHDHPPVGLIASGSSTGTGPDGPNAGYSWSTPNELAYRQAQAEAGVTSDGSDRSVLRTDGLDIWVTSTPAPDPTRGPRIRVTVGHGCPAQLGRAADVSNPDAQLRTRLVPDGQTTGGMICRYQRTLTSSILLNEARARRLAAAASALQLGSEGGWSTSCPAAFFTDVIIVLRYPGRPDADLWYFPSGCQYVDNGYIIATKAGNPSFYAGFIPAVSTSK